MSNDNKDKKTKNKEKVVKDKRALSLKLFSIFSVIILVVIAIVFNILFESILGDKLKIDFTATSQNTITQQTQDYIDSLPDDTYIQIVGLLDRPSNDTFGYSYIVPLLDDYVAKSNGKISVEYKNPESYPSIYKELDPDNVYNLTTLTGQYVIKVGNRIQTVSPMDCFEYDENYLAYGQYVFTKNITESVFTNAIYNAVSEPTLKAYYITDNSGLTHSKLVTVLNGMNIDAEALQITTEFSFPDDCDLLFIENLNTDISPDMALDITDYLSRGGKLIVGLNLSPLNVQEAFSNVNAVLDYMNLKLDFSSVQENNPQYVMNNGTDSHIVPTTDYIDFTNSQTCIGSFLRPVKNSDNNKSYITTSTVLTTSSMATSAAFVDDAIITNNEPSTYYVGMYSTYQGMANPPAVYVFGTTTFTSDEYISAHGMNDGNVVFLRSCVRDLLGDKANNLNNITIEGKNIADYSIDTDKATVSTVNTIMLVFMVILPLAFVVMAVVVFKRRKNL